MGTSSAPGFCSQTTEASIGARLDQLEGLLVKAFPALRGDAYVAVAGS